MSDPTKATRLQEAIAASETTTNTAKPKSKATSSSSTNNRPIHPAVLTTFGPGKGSGSSELSVWAYLTRPRPRPSGGNDGGTNNNNNNANNNSAPLPNLVTAQSNSLRVYTVLPNAGTLALTAVYDNLAGTICSLDVVPNGTSAAGSNIINNDKNDNDGDGEVSKNGKENNNDGDDGLQDIFGDAATTIQNNNTATNSSSTSSSSTQRSECYDGLLLGFAGHPRLSLVYPSTPMVGGGAWSAKNTTTATSSTAVADDIIGTSSTATTTTTDETPGGTKPDNTNKTNEGNLTSGVGQGGVLLASSIIDLTPALVERSMGGTSYLEQDIIVTVSTSSTVASGVDYDHHRGSSGDDYNNGVDPSVSVVLGGGVAIASFSLPKGPRPDEIGSNSNCSSSSSSSSWWRVASEPYILPLSTLSAKVRDLGGTGSSNTNPFSTSANTGNAGQNQPGQQSRGNNNKQQNNPRIDNTVGGGPIVGHGFGDIIDVAFLSGYTEPTLLILHSNPRKGGGRVWPGRLGRTAEVPVTAGTEDDDDDNVEKKKEEEEDDMDTSQDNETKPKKSQRCRSKPIPTGTKYGLTLTAISLSIHQHRSVVLWSLIDALPVDAWKLAPHPTNGVLVWGVNTIVYVSMGGGIMCALSVNGFGMIGCPTGLLPPASAIMDEQQASTSSGGAVYLEPNPSPLPKLAIQLDGSRVSFISNSVAMVCLGNGTLHSLELHSNNNSRSNNAKMMMSLFPLGHRVGGLGVASCLSVMALGCHGKGVGHYLGEDNDDTVMMAKKEEEEGVVLSADAIVSKSNGGNSKPSSSGPKIQARGLVFVGSRMGDCTLLAFSMNEAIRLVVTDVDAADNESSGGDKRKSSGDNDTKVKPGEPMKKIPRHEDDKKIVEISDGDDNGDVNTSTLTAEEILRLEEEELYRDEDDDDNVAAPSVVSSSQVDSEEEVSAGGSDQEEGTAIAPRRRTAKYLSMFCSITALDSLTGLGPLGGGIYGPVATCPSLTGQDSALSSSATETQASSSIFSNAFSSAARHYIMPCGFGASGGLAILTTPGRDNVGGSILCESDLCNMAGPIFGLPKSNLVLLAKADGVGAIALRGIVIRDEAGGEDGKEGGYVEEFKELDIGSSATEKDGDSMDVDVTPSFDKAADVLGKMTLLAANEFCSNSQCFSVLVVRAPHLEGNDPYSIVMMSKENGNNEERVDLKVDFVHCIKSKGNNPPGNLVSITPMASKVSDDSGTVLSLITFGCVWTCGSATVFNISLSQAVGSSIEFKVSESVFLCDDNHTTDDNFYDSNKIVGMDIISLPGHIFDSANSVAKQMPETGGDVDPTPDESTSLSLPPDRLSMHGSWVATLDGDSSNPPKPCLSQNRTIIALCRRSGLLQIYDNNDVQFSSQIDSSSSTLPIWEAKGCSHGTAILGQSPARANIRRPELHEVEVAEIRIFVAGPSLQPVDSPVGIDAEKDAWMLRSLCILVDTSHGDLHLYSGSKSRSNMNRLEFSRVPLSNVSRPSEEAGRHLVKLRRKRIVPSLAKEDFRRNRLHRFCSISGQDGLFAATPRPLWFVSERGAPTVVSHKSRHVSPAGGCPVPVSGFCMTMPEVFQNAKNGFVTIHERIGRVGSQRLTLYNGLSDMFAPHGLLPGGGISIQKVPLGVTVRHIEFIDDASISSTSRPVYAMIVSHEIEGDQSQLNDDGLDPEERQRIKDEQEAERVRKQVEADLGGFDVEQEWVEEIEREECFAVETGLGLAPPMPTRKYELWLVDASSQWNVLDKYPLEEYEHATALKVMFLTDVVEDSDEVPERSLFITVGTSVIDHDGEDLASKGRILLFQVKKSKKRGRSKDGKDPPLELILKSEKAMALGPVTALSSLKSDDIYRCVVGAGAEITVEQWGSGKLTQMGFYHAHMQVQEIVLFKTFFLLSDAYDSLHFLVWRESDKSLTLLSKDYEPTQVFASGLISRGGAMSFLCHDDRQNLSFLQYAPSDVTSRGGNKLVCRADYHLGSQTTSFKSHWGQSSLLFNSCTMTSTLAALKQQDSLFGRLEDDNRFAVNFGTTDGSFGSIVPLSEPTYWRLTALQSVMSNALESNCALSHRAWRLYRRSTRRAGCRSNERKKGVIDGDLVMKFVDLPLPEQEDLASSIGSTVGLVMDNLLELGCAASVI